MSTKKASDLSRKLSDLFRETIGVISRLLIIGNGFANHTEWDTEWVWELTTVGLGVSITEAPNKPWDYLTLHFFILQGSTLDRTNAQSIVREIIRAIRELVEESRERFIIYPGVNDCYGTEEAMADTVLSCIHDIS